MLRFVDSQPASLILNLYHINVKPNGKNFDVNVTQMFPSSDPDPQVLKTISLFAFPHHSAIESKCFFSFVIGDTACDFNIGYVQYFTSFNAICVVSPFYYPSLFKTVTGLPNDKLLSTVEELNEKKVWKQVQINDQTFKLDGGKEKQELMSLMFDTFQPYDILKAIIAMIQAKHIIVLSSSAAVCSKFVAALPLLIDPFRWDMNCIPVLPYKLKEMLQIPVPTMIGLTHAELLCEGRLASNCVINPDIRVTINHPAQEPSAKQTLEITMLMYDKELRTQLNAWNRCPGFPHKQITSILRRFIASYLKLYTGRVQNRNDFIAGLSKIPDFLDSSQVIQDLKHFDHAPDKLKEAFNEWLEEIFNKKRKLISLSHSSSIDSSIAELSKQSMINSPSAPVLNDPAFVDKIPTTPPRSNLAPTPPKPSVPEIARSHNSIQIPKNIQQAAQSSDISLIDFIGINQPGSQLPKQKASSNEDLLDLFNNQSATPPPPKDDIIDIFNINSSTPNSPITTQPSQQAPSSANDLFGLFNNQAPSSTNSIPQPKTQDQNPKTNNDFDLLW